MVITEKKITPLQPLNPIEEKLLSMVDEHRQELINLLQQLVKIDSVNISEDVYAERNEIFHFTEKMLKKVDFKTQLVKVPFPGGKSDKYYLNLIATIAGNAPGKSLQFNGHLDTVAYNPDNWNKDTQPLSAVIKDGRMYGRGAGDMKSGIAAQIMAMKLLKESKMDFNGRLQLWCTPDEETHGAYGSDYMVKHYPELVKTDATVISEARSQEPLQTPVITIGEKGPHWLKFTFYGVAGHGSIPKQKSNALNKAVRFMSNSRRTFKIPKRKLPVNTYTLIKSFLSRYKLTYLIELLSHKTANTNPLEKDKRRMGMSFETTYSFDRIRAGQKVNIVPDQCELDVDFRVLPGLSAQELFDAIANYCSKLGYKVELPIGYQNKQQSSGKFADEPVDIRVSVITIGEGFLIDKDTQFGKVLAHSFEAVYKTEPVYTFASGFSDGGNMLSGGMTDVFIVGPEGSNIHNANEYVNIESVISASKLYLLTAYRYLNS
jgi:succinyl-diaminopimelate desuccinylase